MEEKRNEVLENAPRTDLETSVEQAKASATNDAQKPESSAEPAQNQMTVSTEDVREATLESQNVTDVPQPTADTVILFGKTIPKKPLIIASAIAAAVVILTVTLILIFAKHPIAKFFGKMEKENNYSMTITMSDIPLFGTISMQIKMDGNVTYTPAVLFGEETYTERVGNDVYTYTKDANGNWMKVKQENTAGSDSTANQFAEDFVELLNPKNYKKDGKNKYVQKDDVDFESYDNVVITFENDSCIIEMDVISGGMILRTKIVISDVGDVELTLPKVE